MARKRSRPPPRARTRRDQPRQHLDGLPAPNHLAPLDWPRQPTAETTHRYPLLHLMLPQGTSGVAGRPAFVDPQLRLKHWAERDYRAPPTWMDPEWFVRQVLADPVVQAKCQAIVRRDDPTGYRELEPELDRLLDEQYLVYLYTQFAEVRSLLAQWLVAHTAVSASTPAPGRKP